MSPSSSSLLVCLYVAEEDDAFLTVSVVAAQPQFKALYRNLTTRVVPSRPKLDTHAKNTHVTCDYADIILMASVAGSLRETRAGRTERLL